VRSVDHVPQGRRRGANRDLDCPARRRQGRILDLVRVWQVQAAAAQSADHAAAADSRGNVRAGTSPVDGTVELITSGPESDAVQRKVRAKYGFMVSLSRFFNILGHLGKGLFPYGDVAVVVKLSGPDQAA
jgi:hypothetical protein